MCDYSLHGVKNRLANEGEQLFIHKFHTGSKGLASVTDLKNLDTPAPAGAWVWARFKCWVENQRRWINDDLKRALPAVCLPPDARLQVDGIPAHMQKPFGVGPREEVTFVQLTAEPSPGGKECLLAIHAAGDIFGELCLSGLGARLETAVAMEETVIKQIPCSNFFARLGRDALFEGFVQYLAARIADQQHVIANLVTVDSEQRLGKTLLNLARTIGKKDPRSIRIEPIITHEELSEMVGSTRLRISMFMQRFHNLGLIETNEDHFLIIKEKKLSDYLAQLS